MAVTIALLWIALVLSVIIGSSATGEFTVLHSPDSLKFTGSDKTLGSFLKEIYSASLGLSVEENPDWKGLFVVDPFNTPEAVVEVYIDGVSNLGETAVLKSTSFPLTVDEYEPDTFEGVKHRIKQRFTSGDNKIVNVKLSDANDLTTVSFKNVFGSITSPMSSKLNLIHMKYSVDEDYQFLNELETLRAIIGKIQSGAIVLDNIVDFYSFRFDALHALSDFHGPNSLQTKEAKQLLGNALQDLRKAFVKAYDRSVLVTVVTTDVAHTRRAARSIQLVHYLDPMPNSIPIEPIDPLEPPHPYQREGATDSSDPTTEPPKAEPSTTEPPVTTGSSSPVNSLTSPRLPGTGIPENYSAIFNIILWFGVTISFALLAIVYAIMDMDPGRDSIIYRMTSMKIKKDN